MESVYCTVRTDSLRKADLRFIFKRLMHPSQNTRFVLLYVKKNILPVGWRALVFVQRSFEKSVTDYTVHERRLTTEERNPH